MVMSSGAKTDIVLYKIGFNPYETRVNEGLPLVS